MTIRDYVESVIVDRLNRPLDGDREVTTTEFNYWLSKLEPILQYISSTARLPGFNQEDLYSLYCMHVYQILRRSKLDTKRKAPVGFFRSAINNLNIDIARMIERCKAKGLDFDALDKGVAELKDNQVFLIETTIEFEYMTTMTEEQKQELLALVGRLSELPETLLRSLERTN